MEVPGGWLGAKYSVELPSVDDYVAESVCERILAQVAALVFSSASQRVLEFGECIRCCGRAF